MSLISLEEAKGYLRVDSSDEDTLIGVLIDTSEKLCADVGRLTDEQWADIDSDKCRSDRYSTTELAGVRKLMRTAILYTVAYLYEHREEADHHELTLTLRSILFVLREGVV